MNLPKLAKAISRAALAVAVTLAIVPSANAQAQAPIVIKFSYVIPPDTPKGRGVEKFKELAEARTKGRVKVEVYPNSQLYKDKEELEALQLGSVQMLAPSLAKFGPLGVREFEVFDLPYIFKDEAAFRAVIDGPVGAGLLKKLEPKGIKGLAYWDNGLHVFSANRPLHTPADFKGLKMRIQSSKVLDAQIRALGALPQVMATSELYQGLQSGVVDGAEGDISNFYAQKLFEVQKDMTLTYHGHIAYAVIVNKKFWDGLPPDIRSILEGCMKDATTYVDGIAASENASALEKIKATGKTVIYTPTAQDTEAIKRAVLPVHKEMEDRIGKATIDAVYQAAGFVAPK